MSEPIILAVACSVHIDFWFVYWWLFMTIWDWALIWSVTILNLSSRPHDYIVWICEVAVICWGWIRILEVNSQDFLNVYQGILAHVISKSLNVFWHCFTLFVGINSLYLVDVYRYRSYSWVVSGGFTLNGVHNLDAQTYIIVRFLLTLNLSILHLLMLYVELECRSTINQQFQILVFQAWLLASKRPSLLVYLMAKPMYVPSLIGLHSFFSLDLFSIMVLKIFLLLQPVFCWILCTRWGL